MILTILVILKLDKLNKKIKKAKLTIEESEDAGCSLCNHNISGTLEHTDDENKSDSEEPHKLTAREAVYGFWSWLSTRDEETRIGRHTDSYTQNQNTDLLERFCDENKFAKTSDNWTDYLKYPQMRKNEV